MKAKKRRVLPLMIAIVMALSVALVSLFPVNAADVALTFDQTPYNVTVSASDQTVNVKLSATAAFNCCITGGTVTAASGLEITDILSETGTSMMSSDYNTATGQWTHYTDAGMEDVNISDIITVVVKVPGGTAAGDYTVTISDLVLGYNYGFSDHTYTDTQVATIRVSDVPAPTQGYELYYTLDVATDSDSDNYIEYNPGDTVTATIYLKSNLDDTLQAFDLYITNDANLTYSGCTSDYGTRISGSGSGASTETSQHVQAIGADKDHPIGVALPAGEGVAIATLTFTVADTAEYNVGMPITITDASNIAVAGTPASFTPDIGGTVSGAETLKTYTVTYDANTPAAATAASLTVTGMPSPLTADKGHNVAYTVAAAPSLTNYTFAGWNTEANGSGDSYAAAASYTANADVTLYAQWTPDTHKVEWKTQDGTTILETDATVAFGETLSFNGTEPTKAADAQYTYTFAGWSTTANAETGAAANTYTMGSEDMVLYAAFSKTVNTYTVTWKSQDGSTTYETDENVAFGDNPSFNATEPSKPADATYTYTFAGWATEANQESGTLMANLPPVSGNTEYYAAFSKEYIDYTITYDAGEHPASDYTVPAAKTDAHNGVAYNLPEAPSAADGYTFAGWSSDGGTTLYAGGASYTPTGTATLTAIYTENKYNVTYDINGATGTTPTGATNVPYTQNITLASGTGLSKTGYTFVGWSTDPTATTAQYSAGASVNKLSATNGDTVILYAVWSAAAYTIEYDYDGADSGTPATANVTSYDVEDLPITLNRPTKTGYTFVSWTITVKSGETGEVVADGDQIKAGTWGNLTVKANWTPAEVNYTVKHWQQNIDNNEYTEVAGAQQTLTGLTESYTLAVANSYTGFTAKAFSQVQIAADGSTVVNIYYDRLTYTVTYSYTGSVPSGVTAPIDANSPYKFGATVTVLDTPAAVSGYTFGGWSQTGDFVIDADTAITGNWTLNTYYINFKNDQGTLVEAVPFTAETASITAPSVPAKTENANWYEAGVWGAYDLTNLADQDVTPTYAKKTFTVTFQDEKGDDLADQGSDPNFDYDDRTIDTPAVPDKPGYTGEWPTGITTNPESPSVRPVYTANEYTITFVVDGGTAIPNMTYTIESTDTLPTASGKPNFAFAGWKVTTAGGNWAADSTINGGTAVTGKYGNVTLTAQWTQALTYEVQEYKYAPTGYKLLIIDAAGAGDGNVYTYDGATMYYTTDTNYMIDKGEGKTTAVFYTLIPATDTTLTDAQVGKIAASAGTAAKITYNGDINGDGKINIADANAIYQMVVATGSYYSLDQLTIAQRLAADTVKTTANAEHRGSIEDVNVVVQLINGEIESISNLSNGTIDPQGSVYWLGRKYILAIPTPAETQKFSLCI